ncbi:CoA transferase [Pseudosulfitobacter sp. DSM 107133]|uniref:CoA transferase n=1 Tax=Pseudosulfitobacter sp. DSM 107133 TaxID=2883100 RepID=UPI001F0818DC|nr:CoA transferase [Pseudosulfitobacter sp. DSM 107133]
MFLKRADLGSDPRFATNNARVANRGETDAAVAAGFATRNGPEAIAALQRADVALASVNDMAGLSAHPHLRRITVETPSGPVSYPAPAPVWHNETPTYGPVPALNPLNAKD